MRRKLGELDLEHQTLEGQGSFNMTGAQVDPFFRGDSLWHAVPEAVWEEDRGPHLVQVLRLHFLHVNHD